MTGIVISGGTYSGSGDVTTEYLYCLGSGASGDIKPTCYLPEGTFTVTGENSTDYGGEGYTGFAVNLPREAGLLNNPNLYAGTRGTTRITTAATTKIYMQYVKNGIIAYSGAASCQTIGDLNTADELHIEDGTFWSNGSSIVISGNAKAYDGGILDLDSNNINASFGSLEIKTGGIVSGNTDGTITINYDYYNRTDLYSVMYRNNGTFVANDGTLILKYNKDALLGGGGGTGTPYNMTVNLLAGGVAKPACRVYSGVDTTCGGDLTLSGSLEWNDNLGGGMAHVVTGTVTIQSGASYNNFGASGAPKTFGGLNIADDISEYIAPQAGASTILNSYFDGDKVFVNNGTFTHSDGVVEFKTSAQYAKLQGTEQFIFYDVLVDGVGGAEGTHFSTTNNAAGIIVGNNLTIAPSKSMSIPNVGYPFIVSGTTLISGTWFNYSDNWGNNAAATFTTGKLNIADGGTYEATKQETTIDMNMTGDGTDYGFQNNGTFTHNSGTVVVTGTATKCYINFTGSVVDPVFYNLTIKQTGDYAAIHTDLTVENMLDNQTYFMMNGGYNDFTLTMGTTGSEGVINNAGSARSFSTNYLYYKDLKIKAASEVYPAVISGTDNPFTMSNSGQLFLENVNLKVDYTTEGTAGGVGFILSGSNNEFDALTIAEGDTVNCSSGSRVTFGGALNVNSSGQAVETPEAGLGAGLVISGALIEMKDAASWSESKYQNYMGRNSASAIWNSTGIYSPNGGYLNYGWENMLWNAEARVNQDGVFRNTNLIVGGQLDANNRAIANSGSPTKLTIANGGTVSSSTNTYNVSKFSNRGGMFASSSALYLNGGFGGANTGYMAFFPYAVAQQPTAGAGESFTVEGWFKANSAGYQVLARSYGNGEWMLLNNNGGDKLGFTCRDDTNTETTIRANEVLPYDGSWIHIAAVAGDTFQTLYYDGKLVASGTKGTGVEDSTGAWAIGTNPDIYSNPWNYMFAGYCGMLRVWDGTCTPAEIRANMFDETPTAAGATLKANVMFNDGEGEVVTDEAGNGNGYLSGSSVPFSDAWANGGTWRAGNILSGSSANLYIGKGTYSTDFASSYYALENTYLISGAKWTSKAHSGSNDYYIDAASGTTFNFSQIGNEPQPIVRNAVPPTGGSDVTLLDTELNGGGNYTFIFDEGENDLGTAKDCKQLTVEEDVTFKVTTGVDYYTQDFKNRGTWEHGIGFDGTIHDDGSLPTEYEPIDLKQHISDPPIDMGLAID